MKEVVKDSEHTTYLKWIKFGCVDSLQTVGSDTLLLFGGNYLLFVETSPQYKEIFYSADGPTRGDGVQCVAGHRNLSCFAFAEKVKDPRVLIVAYPSFKVVKIIPRVKDTSYPCMGFSELEYLITITRKVSDFKFIAWNWRTLEKICVGDSVINEPQQVIRVSQNSPIRVAQGSNKDTRLCVWEIHPCCKKNLLTQNMLKFPAYADAPLAFTWTTDGDFFIADSRGAFFSASFDSYECTEEVIFSSTTSSQSNNPGVSCVVSYKTGILAYRFGQISFISKKKPEGWQAIWTSEAFLPACNIIMVSPKESIFAWTSEYALITFKGDQTTEYQSVKKFGSGFDSVCVIHPAGNHFMTFSMEAQRVVLWDIGSGEQVNEIEFESTASVTTMACLPTLPLAILCFDDGSFHGINAFYTDNLSVRYGVLLTRKPLNVVSFPSSGRLFCLAAKENGGVFLIDLKFGNAFQVIAGIELGYEITDILFDETTGQQSQMIVIPAKKSTDEDTVLQLFSVDTTNKSFLPLKTIRIEEAFSEIMLNPTSEGFISASENSNMIYFVDFDGNTVYKAYSGHLLTPISLHKVGKELLSFGRDGLVIAHTSFNSYADTAIYPLHHRYDGGTASVDANAGLGFVLARGKDGSLMCCCTGLDLISEKSRTENMSLLSSEELKELFRPMVEKELRIIGFDVRVRNVVQFKVEESTSLLSWLEEQEEERIQKIKEDHKAEQEEVLKNMQAVKDKLKLLLDANENSSMEEKLPVSAFELNPKGRKAFVSHTKRELLESHKLEQAKIFARDKVSNYILNTLWNKMAVHSRELRGFNSNIIVESYALEPDIESETKDLPWLKQRMRLVTLLHDGDFFTPWIPRTDNDLREHLNQTWLSSGVADFTSRYTKAIDENDEEELAKAWAGSTSHQFIEVNSEHVSQLHIATSLQIKHEIKLIQGDIRALMIWFNEQFDIVYAGKERKLKAIIDWKARLQHIIGELEFFKCPCDLKVEDIQEPTWMPKEKPEDIVIVQEHELQNKPYLTKEQKEEQARLEAEATERRLRFLADNFKQVALDTMMDGVLEKLWQDEIKKDVQAPKFMTEKDAEYWTDEEHKKAKSYIEAVGQLQVERTRYQKLLGVELGQITTAMQESSAKFDEEVAVLYELKLRVESAVSQEQLKILRMRRRILEKNEMNSKEDELRSNIEISEKKLEVLQEEVSKLQELVADGKTAHENLTLKDKNFDKNFRKDFPEYSPVICEQLLKLSKKRPKLTGKATSCTTFLNEMGQALVQGTRPDLSPECVEFLKGVDALDSPVNAPAVVTEQSWESLCRIRRAKIESEFKIRALSLEIAESEGTVAAWFRSIKMCKETIVKLQADLQNLREEKMNQYHNMEIQLVVKQGLVEVGMSGMMNDFQDSVMINRSDILQINEEIRKVGQQKLTAMQKANELRKSISYREWEHKKLRMVIEDLDSTLETLEHVTVTKELQDILTARARGDFTEKGFSLLEKELAHVKARFEKSRADLLKNIGEYDKKIADLTRKNADLDEKIVKLNTVVGEKTLLRDVDKEKMLDNEEKRRMRNILYRKKLNSKIEDQDKEISMLAMELDMLRRRTYPAIHHKREHSAP